MMSWKSILKPEGSVTIGVATVAAVAGLYNLSVGSMSQAAATDPNHPVLESTKRKAGYTALALVGGLFLVTKDANIAILGGATIIVMELSYRTSIMSHPMSGKLMNPNPAASYEPAENVIPIHNQGETG